MELKALLDSKDIKPKEKTETISQLLIDKKLSTDELIKTALSSKDSPKATCIEALEFATLKHPEIATKACLDFVSATLTEKAPRVKWESSKVIGNIAHLYADHLDTAVKNLLVNTEHEGTVVRWSAAFALGQIVKTKHPKTKVLIPALEAICTREEKNSIKKIYTDALKKCKA